jgi:hypothetical protein
LAAASGCFSLHQTLRTTTSSPTPPRVPVSEWKYSCQRRAPLAVRNQGETAGRVFPTRAPKGLSLPLPSSHLPAPWTFPRALVVSQRARGSTSGDAASHVASCGQSYSDVIIRVVRIEMRISRQASSLFLVRGFVQGFNSAPLSVIGLVEIEQNRADKPFLRSAVRRLP